MKNNKKVETETKSGSGAKKTKRYIYNDQLQFLKKNMPIENTSSTLINIATTQQTTSTTTVLHQRQMLLLHLHQSLLKQLLKRKKRTTPTKH